MYSKFSLAQYMEGTKPLGETQGVLQFMCVRGGTDNEKDHKGSSRIHDDELIERA